MASPYLKRGTWYLRWKDEAQGLRSADQGGGATAPGAARAPGRAGPVGRGGRAPRRRRRVACRAASVVARHVLEAARIPRDERERDPRPLPRVEPRLAATDGTHAGADRNASAGEDGRGLAADGEPSPRIPGPRFSAARRAGRYAGPNPVVDVRKRKVLRRKPDFLRIHEVPLLLRALDPRWRPLFATAIYTGLRKGELLALRKSDVHLDRRS
jgi:hypothetical protein